MDLSNDEKRSEGLVIGLLEFPKGGTFGLDGQNIVLKTNDFLGVTGVPSDAFHLVTCKNGHAGNRNATNTIDTAVTVGFLVFGSNDEGSNSGHLVRRYDPRTEEVASQEQYPVDEITQRNLVRQMKGSHHSLSQVLQYDQVVGCGSINQEDHVLSPHKVWSEQTRYIHNASSRSGISLLRDIRKISTGDKIVPGCFDPENEVNNKAQKQQNEDGKSLVYPPIPVVDPGLSLAKHKHHGTNRFLSNLNPKERTKLFLLSTIEDFVWLDIVLKNSYKGSWEALLGDLQLSYILFLYLGCFSSLQHWKDLLAMLSLAVIGIENDGLIHKHKHESLYRGLLQLLPYQLSSMNDPEFLEDIDEGGGNFLVPSLERLKRYYETKARQSKTRSADDEDLLQKFQHVLSAKFPQTFSNRPSLPTITRIQSDTASDMGNGNKTRYYAMDVDERDRNYGWGADDDDDDDDDGPVVVSSEEIEASMARSSSTYIGSSIARTYTVKLQLAKDYPLLAAAIMPSEDVLMTCARALDEKTDVSLVREAAAYLQEVEQQRGFF